MAVRSERGDAATSDEEDGFITTPKPRENPYLGFAREHVPLLAAAIAALIFAIRCVAVSKGDPFVAAGLLAQTSLGDAIRALLFAVGPPLLMGVSFLFALFALGALRRQAW